MVPPSSKAAKVVAHSTRRVAARSGLVQGSDPGSQHAIREALRRCGKAADRREEGHDARITPAEARGLVLILVHRREHDALEGLGSNGAVVRHAFEAEESMVDVATNGS